MEQLEGQPAEEHEGERYLRLIGLGHLAGREVVTKHHGTIRAEDFLDVCGKRARPMLVGFEAMSPDDPNYGETKELLRKKIGEHIGEDSPS